MEKTICAKTNIEIKYKWKSEKQMKKRKEKVICSNRLQANTENGKSQNVVNLD